MPGGGMAQTIQLISALADIQQKRRSADLAERQIEESKAQFAQRLGFQEKSAEYKKVGDLVDAIARSSSEARGSIMELGRSLNLPPAQVEALAHLAQSAPETIEALKSSQATQGVRNPNANTQQRETASVAMTGMPLGGVAQSGLQAILAGQAQGQVTPDMTRGYAEKAATGRSPLEAIIQTSIAQNPDMRGRMAGVTAGTQMSATAARQAQIGEEGNIVQQNAVNQRSIESQMDIGAKLATAKVQGTITPEILMQGFGKLIDYHKALSDPKTTEAVRLQAQAEYNNLVVLMGYPDLQWTNASKPTQANIFQRMQNAVVTPGPANPSPGASGPPAPPGFDNSLQHFIRP